MTLRGPDSGGLLGAAVAGWIATSPSLLPRTWWMWTADIGISQACGYAAGAVVRRALRAAGRALGCRAPALPRTAAVAVLSGISALSWVRGVLRQQEISRLVEEEPKPLRTHLLGTAAGVAASAAALATVRGVLGAARLYRDGMRRRMAPRGMRSLADVLAVALLVLVLDRAVRHRVLARALEHAERTNRLLQPDLSRPTTPLRSGGPGSGEDWAALGAAGRRIVSGGPSRSEIAAATDAPAREPIRVYAGKTGGRTLSEAVAAVVAELERTGAFRRRVVVLATGTGTGWLQEWSLSSIEYLTGGDCATASLQYSVTTSALGYLLDRTTPQRAGAMLFTAVRRRLAELPPDRRPQLYVTGESLGSFGGQAAFRDAADMLASIDGAVWTGTPGFTPIHRELTARRRPGSPQIAPVIDAGRHIRFVACPTELRGTSCAPWQHPRVVYAQHASDPVVWWGPQMLWRRPEWLRERAGRDVTGAMRWFPWITFWQIAADMPLSIAARSGHGHAYREEMLPIWAAVLGIPLEESRRLRLTAAIRAGAE